MPSLSLGNVRGLFPHAAFSAVPHASPRAASPRLARFFLCGAFPRFRKLFRNANPAVLCLRVLSRCDVDFRCKVRSFAPPRCAQRPHECYELKRYHTYVHACYELQIHNTYALLQTANGIAKTPCQAFRFSTIARACGGKTAQRARRLRPRSERSKPSRQRKSVASCGQGAPVVGYERSL